MSSLMLEIVCSQGGAIFSQFQEQIGPETQGTGHIHLVQYPNVVLWTNVSEVFVNAFNLAQPSLEMKRANPMAYAYFSDEFGYPALPVVSVADWRDQKLDYTDKHWFPAIFFVLSENAPNNCASESKDPVVS